MSTTLSYPTKLFELAVEEFAKLPGIGRKTAFRLVLHLLKEPNEEVEAFGNAIIKLRNEVIYCSQCHNISDSELCLICSSPKRNHNIVCVVEDARDLIAIENTSQYNGVYHIIGGIISPMDGVSPDDLNLNSLFSRLNVGNVSEVILALPSTIEGDTTAFYIYKNIKGNDIKISVIARGISFGSELEYADEITLGRSIVNRIPYTQ